jgi:hypothetical protein
MSSGEPIYPEIKVRHLCFFLMPIAGKGDVWRRNLDELKQRISLFNGRRRICVVQNSRDRNLALEHPLAVQNYASDLGCEFVTVDNDPNLREVAGWEPLLGPLATTRDDEAIFWAHGKATTHGAGGTPWRWGRMLYEISLDRWDLVEKFLQRYPIAGAFKRSPLEFFEHRPTNSTMEFHGSFFWFRAAEFFRRDWRAIEKNWTGVETAPGVIFKPEEAGAIWPPQPIPLKFTLYHESDMQQAEREWEQFKRANPKPVIPAPPAKETGFPPIRVRHLAYVVLPVAGNQIWRKNLDQLIPHLPLFNGRRRVAILTGSAGRNFVLDPPERVRDYLRGHDIEFVEKPNNPLLREGEVWQDLFGPLQGAGEDEVCLFAHAKGVTRTQPEFAGAHRWASVLYRASLNHWPRVEQLLAKFPIAGPMKHVGRNYFRTPSRWQFLGSFFWVRLAEMFRRDWRQLDQNWAAVETWCGLHYGIEEGAAIFPERPVPDGQIYTSAYWDQMEKQFDTWEKSIMPQTLPQQATLTPPADWPAWILYERSLAQKATSGRYSTDKETLHSYCSQFYDREFCRFGSSVRLLEVGVRTGGSLKLWRDHFDNHSGCEIHGVDLDFRNLERDVRGSERITLHQANGYDPAFAAKWDWLDVCVDDGSHRIEDQIKFVELYWPKIERGGWLVVEDLKHPSHFDALKRALPERDRESAICLDLRHVKGRDDDLLFAIERH